MQEMPVPPVPLRETGSLTLAFVGDGVYELLVRERLAASGLPTARLHQIKVELVRAEAQAAVYDRLQALLTEGELAVMRRGRNAHPGSSPKNASPADYHKATGVEALFGYLYLSGNIGRLEELFRQVVVFPEL